MPTAIIIDDTARDREHLRALLAHYPEVRIVAECESGQSGIAAIEQLRPELVFLDVEMPGMSGLEMLRHVKDQSFAVIFTTAHDQFAVQAFRMAATDYLLKPVVPEELAEAIGRFNDLADARTRAGRFEVLMHNLADTNLKSQRLAVKGLTYTEVVAVGDVVCCLSAGADGNSKGAYTSIILKNKKRIQATTNLKHYEKLLRPLGFIRLSRQHLVNPDHVTGIRTDEVIMRFSDGSTTDISVPSGSQGMEELRNRLLH